MPIAGVVILAEKEEVKSVLDALQKTERVTTYGIHKGNNIVAVFEGDSAKALEDTAKAVGESIPGILGVFPSYVNYEDEIEVPEEA